MHQQQSALISSMTLPRFDYEAPADLETAIARLAQARGEARVLAGGTDLVVRMKRGVVKPRLVVSLVRIRGLDSVTPLDNGGVRVGALCTMAQLANCAALGGALTALVEGAASVGGPIIRNRATLGGNIVNARPCADTVPALVALGATLHLAGAGGRRTENVDGFITGPGQTLIGDDEIVTAIELPGGSTSRRGSCYLKMTRRAAMEVTLVGCAARVDLDADRRTIGALRLVLASVAPIPLRVVAAEEAARGRVAGDEVIRQSAALAREAARPIDDCRAPADFRAAIVEVLARRALTSALARAGWRAS
jgi:carbon-monoxide dehydrogenase medium subunit